MCMRVTAYVFTSVRTCVGYMCGIRTHMHMHIHTCGHVHTCKNTYVHMHERMHGNTYTHTHAQQVSACPLCSSSTLDP